MYKFQQGSQNIQSMNKPACSCYTSQTSPDPTIHSNTKHSECKIKAKIWPKTNLKVQWETIPDQGNGFLTQPGAKTTV